MSGSGRKSYYRKNVTSKFLNDLPVFEDSSDEIVKVKASRGTNIFEIERSNGNLELAMMPTKFKKLIWIKRGDFVIASSFDDPGLISTKIEAVTTNTSSIEDAKYKVKYMISEVLNKERIKHLRSISKWPMEFELDNGVLIEDAKINQNNGKSDRGVSSDSYIGMPSYEDIDDYEEGEEDEDNDEIKKSNHVDSKGNDIINTDDDG